MEGFNNTFNVTMQAIQLLSEAYNFCYVNLQKSNIPIPPLEQVIKTLQNMTYFILSNSPAFVRQLYSHMSQVLDQSNAMNVFLSLVILYILYCFIMATFRWIYRLVYGFIKFSLTILTIGGILYLVHLHYFDASPTQNEDVTKSFRVQT